MPCTEPLCRLNDELLALLPTLETEHQQRLLRQWPDLDFAGRDALLRQMREAVAGEADLMTLAKLADYFQCGVYDLVRYTRTDETTAAGNS